MSCKWYIFLTTPELTCCVSNQKMFHFIVKENAFIKNCFFPEKYLQHTFLTYIFGKISFLLSQKVTAGCAEDWLMLAWVILKVLMFHYALQTGINRFQHTMLSFLLPGWKHLKKKKKCFKHRVENMVRKKNTSGMLKGLSSSLPSFCYLII